jgi:hypothetical protein
MNIIENAGWEASLYAELNPVRANLVTGAHEGI